MHIEKINDRQIRCTLNQKDLQDREIGINELAYGTAKAKALFRDMMQQASYEFGFDADDIPLMIEAIPLLPEALVLVVTKIEEPDELDTRFSYFSEDQTWDDFDEEFDYDDYDFFSMEEEEGNLMDPKIEEKEVLWTQNDTSEEQTDSKIYENTDFISLSEVLGIDPRPKQAVIHPEKEQDAIFIFSFATLEIVNLVADLLKSLYHGDNALYKDTLTGKYYLLLHRIGHSPEEFNKICNLLHEYGTVVKKHPTTLLYFEEHYQCILKKDALNKLASL